MNKIKKKISIHKRSVTQAATFAANISDSFDIDLLKLRLKALETTWESLGELINELIEFVEDSNFEDSDIDISEYEEKYFVAHSALTKSIRERLPPSCTEPLLDKSVVDVLTQQQTNSLKTLSDSKKIKSISLPTFHIPPFSGDYKDWPCFRDLFISSIDDRDDISATQKFRYLKTLLRDRPAELISKIPVSDINYPDAWERLERRYDRSNLIVHSHIQDYLSLPTVPSNNVALLRKVSDGADECIRALKALEAEGRDPWLVYILLLKLDQETKEAWAQEVGSRDNCEIKELLDFLQLRCDALESCQSLNRLHSSRGKNPLSIRAHLVEDTQHASSRCPMCNSGHLLGQCSKFVALSTPLRREFVKTKSLCFSCLKAGHSVNRCRSMYRCRLCKSKHHYLVHPENENASTSQNVTDAVLENDQPTAPVIVSNHSHPQYLSNRQTILPTIVAKVKDMQGNFVSCRILLDSGSQSSFVSESFVQKLGLPRTHARIPVVGVSATEAGYTRGCVSIKFYSRINSRSLPVDVFVLSKLTSNLPTRSIDTASYKHIRNLNLADPSFDVSRPVDALLGADKLWNILDGKQIKGPDGTPIAQSTFFGWVITGECFVDQNSLSLTSFHSTLDIDQLLRKFWELEEVSPCSKKPIEDIAETHFRKTFSRSPNGRYIVQLPFIDSTPVFGDTLPAAISRLHSMERRFSKNKELFESYSKFMLEYLALGHMERIPSEELKGNSSYQFYLPHHAVFKMDSSTTKLRVVFDGSSKDSFGRSLNSTLLIGPPIQRDLVGVCLKFRQHRYVFSADVVKMFRQILVDTKHTDFQRIVWRENPCDEIQHFRLCTVTYGTACAPFLSIRVLNQLAQDYHKEYPNASQVLLNDVYVDDVMTGTDSVDSLLKLQSELVALLSKAKLNLRKWSSNCWPFLSRLPPEDCEYSLIDTEVEGSGKSIKVLGMYWNPSQDEFLFKINTNLPKISSTRRTLLSEISRIYDPLGFLAPSVISFKILFQRLWIPEFKLSWDDELPSDVAQNWIRCRSELPFFEQIRVPRHIISPGKNMELHGFSDASSVAYSAVVYSRCELDSGKYKVTIIAAKTKVAPLKPVSIPRLELCGALLLSRLLTRVKTSLTVNISKTVAWCDSEIVLHWLASPPRRWTSFVANRCGEILDTLPRCSWHHISSEENPADCASRGILPSKLVQHMLWWDGPSWLSLSEQYWPVSKIKTSKDSECQAVKNEERPVSKQVLFTSSEDSLLESIFKKHSSWTRLQRSIAYCFRFVYNSRCRKKGWDRRVTHLTLSEIGLARTTILKYDQEISFRDDLQYLIKHKRLPQKSKLLRYSAFIGADGLLRVGGRIKHANISFNLKHPLILSNKSIISSLIVTDIHRKYLHTGVSETFAIVRQQYWILGSRNLIRKVIFNCKPCFMQRRLRSDQLMGDLPKERIQPTRPFINSGVDYAGPLTIKFSSGRNPKLTKAYVALFVCLSTKAVHLEAVSDLTTDAFLAALRRFVSRRGRCANLYSDNGTNFQGARRCLTEMHKLVLSQQHNSVISTALVQEGIDWHFIPPSAPHFGGLWEAGVKSMKFHLRRVIGSTILTFEELTTVLSQIEAILNSRPLCSISDDDLNPLTPAHFLIGEPLTIVPEPTLGDIPQNRLTHWNLLQSMVQGFWRRWHMEYLTTLQERKKWQQPKLNLKPGDLVVIKEPNLPPTHWVLARVEDVTRGADGIVRVANLRTAKGTFTRPVHKLALLPTS